MLEFLILVELVYDLLFTEELWEKFALLEWIEKN